MKRLILSFLIVLGMLIPRLSFAEKLHLEKTRINRKQEKKIHPIEHLLSGTGKLDRTSREANKLLVLLVDFQEDNDPQTTGTGKFIQYPGDYPFTFGRPPHDLLFFGDQLEALRQYYIAVSYGSFNVDSDIYPQAPITQFDAYTLPHEMSYYNPPGASSELMVSRFEEYFQDAFITADPDTLINFSLYDHFMIIHAGSDWQHDVNGDSPADIPSFFIKVGTGKEVYVDDGIMIDHACNVPETITQDIEIDEENGETYIFNYGFINAVMVHEFGHSLGFADLYNTMNYSPQVGYYDIMDSGGAPLIGASDGDLTYYLEGVYPALPGSWSRIIAFEDDFRARGILKDITEFDLSKSITVLPSSKPFDANALNDSTAYIVKVPLNDTEYLLIENRQIDPDGDGGNVVMTSNDGRVILYPTYPDPNPSSENNYEYDFLLPGFDHYDAILDKYFYFGGGLLVWHIDNAILEENDNYINNTVNIRHSHRAVKIVEADNIDDIGNPYSMFWQGTAYEPFFKYMPIIDEAGSFQGWDDEYILNSSGDLEFIGMLFSDELSSISSPALNTNDGDPSIFSIYDISSYSVDLFQKRAMSFHFGVRSFDVTEKIAEFDSLKAIGQIGTSLGFPTFPILTENEINFYSLIADNWANNFGASLNYSGNSDFPIIPIDSNLDGESEYLISDQNESTSFTIDTISISQFGSNLSDAPIFIENWVSPTLVIPTDESLHFIPQNQQTDIHGAVCSYDGVNLIAATAGKIYLIPDISLSGASIQEIEIENYSPVYRPVSFVDEADYANNATFMQNKDGDIYKIQNGVANEIFRLSPYTSAQPSQLALGDIFDDGNVYLAFGAGDRVFAITLDGTLASGFPGYLENRSIKAFAYPRIIAFPDETVIVLEEAHNGFVAVNTNAKQSLKYSFYWARNDVSDQYYWDDDKEYLYYIYADNQHNLFSSYSVDIVQNPLIWNGFRNQKYSIYNGSISPAAGSDGSFSAYAFPNPAGTGEVRFKVLNADSDIKLKIFDIAGNLLHDREVNRVETNAQDIRWNTSKIAPGVYFAVIKSGGKTKKVPFAVVN
ncbi:MAG: T9SS type A sorting domain-containing protein [Candidatus Cloacimonadales bacterium]|nr:T9SS type A sorting domain-containing protein [Candidatus Cloacimonadales bacterium]